MKFAFQIVSVLPLASLVFGQEDGLISNPTPGACGADRCVEITPKYSDVAGAPFVVKGANQLTRESTQDTVNDFDEFDYDKFFDFDHYDKMCTTCYDLVPGTAISKGTWTATTGAAIEYQYIVDDLNCKKLSAVGYGSLAAGTFQYQLASATTNVVFANAPKYRIMKASFWQDTNRGASYVASTAFPTKYYLENYCVANFRDYLMDPCCEFSESPSRQPSKAPSSAPSVSPTTSSPKKNPCFSMMSTVYVQEKGQTSMANVEVGDVVLTMNGFEKIYTIDHRNENEATDFVQIVTETDSAIELTSKHLIYLHDKHDPVEAGTVKVGDKLLTGTSDAAEVSKVSIVTRNGLFNPITSSGTLVVDGIATSTYTAVDVTGGSSYLTIGGYKIMSMHDFMHLAMGPFKLLCLNVPEAISNSFCLIEEGEEHNAYNKVGLQLLSFGKNQNNHVQSAIVLSLVTLFVGVTLFFSPIVVMILLMYTVKTFQKAKNL